MIIHHAGEMCMQRIWGLILALLGIAVAMVGCGRGNSEKELGKVVFELKDLVIDGDPYELPPAPPHNPGIVESDHAERAAPPTGSR